MVNSSNIDSREQHEQCRERDDDPRLLKGRLHLRARGSGCDSGQRVHERHAEHVGERQPEGATRRHRRA
jgi:hypothetical protein